jgi:hypothetical protein
MDCSFNDFPLSLRNRDRFFVPFSGKVYDMPPGEVLTYLPERKLRGLPEPRQDSWSQ